jgi:hypothetical protein
VDEFAATLLVSEPWEFGTANGVGPFRVVVIASAELRLVLLQLVERLEFEGVAIDYLIGFPRYQGSELREATDGDGLHLNLVPVSAADVAAGRAADAAANWRGWQLIGSLRSRSS